MKTTIDQVLQQGVAAHREGRFEEAEKLYKSILNSWPQHPDANHNLGILVVGVGKARESLPYFKAALKANPGIKQFWLSYIDALVKLGHFETAKALLQRGKEAGLKNDIIEQLKKRLDTAQETGDSLQDQLKTLLSLYSQGHFKTALDKGITLISQFPSNPVIPNILGAIYAALEQYEEAITHYNKSIELKPDSAEAYNNLGALFRKTNEYEKAITNYNKAIELKPDSAEAYNNLGNIYNLVSRAADAVASYIRAIELNPDYIEAYNGLGVVLNQLGREEEAITHYGKAILLDPEAFSPRLASSFILQKLGDYSRAIEILSIDAKKSIFFKQAQSQ